MGLPFDPEEIFGVALVDTFRRTLLFIACTVGASLLACMALGMGEAVVGLDPGEIAEWLPYFWFLFLAPLVSGWGVLYVPCVLGAGFAFATGQGSLFRPFLAFLGIQSLLIVFTASGFEWECLVSVIALVGCYGGIVWLGLLLEQRWRRKSEEHFMSLAIENQQRREGLREDFGTDAFDELNDGS
ncbi:hypothetical protein [Haloferula sp.]|uniref:hypothetical protein n=1 Tax=Haloferula sp. TaxID=2497595 RepID=UPI003C76ADE2